MGNQKNAQNTPEEQALIEKEYHALVNDYLHSNHRKKVEKIEKAFRFSNQAHQGMKRRSGEPYIMHPLAVARIVATEIGLGSTSICASLLHDVVEDTDYTVEDIENLFGKKIASIVDGLTKIAGGVFGERASEQAENFRKLLLTMSEDIRVILIKIADRLHNMRTLGSMPEAKQFKIAGETQYIYAPLANRLGLHSIKTELEDLSFKYEHPDKYEELSLKLENTQHERDRLFKLFSQPVKEKLEEIGFKPEIHARIKSVYSIWHKMQVKAIPFEEVYDILALRIIFDIKEGENEKECCWKIYSAITSIYKPHPDRIRDWISTPKANGYEALHVTVMGPEGRWIEVQIRSRRMNDIAEKGFAAHWRYKTHEDTDSQLEDWLQTIKELLENPEPNAIDFMDTFKLNLFASEIFVFTPAGDIRTLPQGATALDFAFSLHSDVGFQCIGAKVNHKLVPLSYVLKSGDQVEVLTSKKQKPNSDWINFVKTARARGKIRSLFKKEYRAFMKKGEHLLQAELEKISLTLSSDTISKLLEHFHEEKKEALYYKIGKGTYILEDMDKTVFKGKTQSRWIERLIPRFGKSSNSNPAALQEQKKQSRKVNQKEVLKITDDESGINYRTAECCNPIPGDDILAFVEEDGLMIVHKRQCPVAMRLKSNFGERIVSAVWETHKVLSFPATIEIKGIDRVGILTQIAKVISDIHTVNINKINLEAKDGIFEGSITVYVHEVGDINNLSMNILNIQGIKSVNRIN